MRNMASMRSKDFNEKSYKRFAKLLDREQITPYRLAKELDMEASTFTDWKKLKSAPKIEKMYKIAKYFDVPLEYFVE